MRAYLDNAATTPMLPEAVEAMLPYLAGTFGNPSGSHGESRRARRAVDDSRQKIAGLLGVDLGEVVFTGSGTEADNLAVIGAWTAAATGGPGPGPMVCSAMEHHAVLNTARWMCARSGVELREVRTDVDGLVDLEALADACTPDVRLVSVMAVNNEIGTVQPLEHVASLVRQAAPQSILHTDAVQGAPWLDLATVTTLSDLTAVSAHKFGGPKGVGALVVRDGIRLEALVHGGGQERERRSGTHNVAGIVAMAAALEVTAQRQMETAQRVRSLRDRLCDSLLASIPGTTETATRGSTVPGIAHLRFDAVEAEALVILLDEAGVAASAGAACSSGGLEPSHVLASMGLDGAAARSGIRFSLGAQSTEAEVDLAVAVVPDLVARLRN